MIQNNIEFNSVKSIGISFENGPIGFEGISGVDPEFGGVINAVDIDWNEAKLELPESLGGTQYITSSGQLLSIIKNIADTYSYVEPTRTLQSIMWSGGSVSPTTINEGSTGTFNKGTVTAVFDNGDLVNVTSSATFTQYINNVSKGTISGTSVTAPSVSANSTVTIKASYEGKIASETVTYTAKDVPAETYYWYIGTESINSSNYMTLATQVNDYTSPYEYTNTSGSRSYVYILVHNTKSIQSIIGKATGGTVTYNIDDTVNIDNYNVYKTVAISNGSTIIITIK